MKRNIRIFLLAGEISGDYYLSRIMSAFSRQAAEVTYAGIGGDAMLAEGLNPLRHIRQIEVFGFAAALKRYPYLKRLFRTAVDELDVNRPDLVVLSDYSGFNLPFAAEARKRDIPVAYFVSPQVWASRPGRVEKIKASVDEMVVLFPFEVPFYAERGKKVHFLGHPLEKNTREKPPKNTVSGLTGLDENKKWLTLMPGSRASEIRNNLPLMLETAAILRKEYPDTETVICLDKSADENALREKFLTDYPDVKIARGVHQEVCFHSFFTLVCSGTACLETALLGCPSVIVYKTNRMSLLIARLLKIHTIGMPNILLKEKVIPEVLSATLTPPELAAAALNILKNPAELDKQKEASRKLHQILKGDEVYEKAADLFLKLIEPEIINSDD